MKLLEICKYAVSAYDKQIGVIGELEYNIDYVDNTMIVSVRGTEAGGIVDVLLNGGWRDVMRDLRFIPRYHKTLDWCHGGFLRGAVALVEKVKKLQIGNNQDFIFTGHSMGAAVSLLAAHLMYEENAYVKWVGFGCPRPYIGEQPTFFTAYNVVNGDDIVTTLPKGWLFDYRLNVLRTIQIGDSFQNPNMKDHSANEYLSSMFLYSDNQVEI